MKNNVGVLRLSLVAFVSLGISFSARSADTPAAPASPPVAAEKPAEAPAAGGGDAAAKDPVVESCGHRVASPEKTDEQKALKDAKDLAIAVLKDSQAPFARAAICYINQLVATNRIDQATIYGFVRQVRSSFEDVKASGGDVEVANKIDKLLDQLMVRSYEDWLFQNANLSNQIQKRLPAMVADAATLTTRSSGSAIPEPAATEDSGATKPNVTPAKPATTKEAASGASPKAEPASTPADTKPAVPQKAPPALVARRLEYFYQDLKLLSDRYFKSRRALAGVGLGYSYLPSVLYSGRTRIDISDILPSAPPGADRLSYESQFSNTGFESLNFTAMLPVFMVQLSLQNLKEKRTSQTPVFMRPFDSDEDLMGRSTIQTTLTSNYDLNIRFSLFDAYDSWARKKFEKKVAADSKALLGKQPFLFDSRDDIELGIGITGFGVKDSVSTDFRRRADPGLTYSELSPFVVKETKSENKFNGVYAMIGYRLDITDQFTAGLLVRKYLDQYQQFDGAKIDDFGVSITATYYPFL